MEFGLLRFSGISKLFHPSSDFLSICISVFFSCSLLLRHDHVLLFSLLLLVLLDKSRYLRLVKHKRIFSEINYCVTLKAERTRIEFN